MMVCATTSDVPPNSKVLSVASALSICRMLTKMSQKDITARLEQLYGPAYQKNKSSHVKIGIFLSRPEYKFERDRKSSGMVYWLKER